MHRHAATHPWLVAALVAACVVCGHLHARVQHAAAARRRQQSDQPRKRRRRHHKGPLTLPPKLHHPPTSESDWRARRDAVYEYKRAQRELEKHRNGGGKGAAGADANCNFLVAGEVPARVVRAEEVIQRRVGALRVVVQASVPPFEAHATLRTLEGLGVQRVALVGVDEPSPRDRHRLVKVVKGSVGWLDVANYPSDAAFVDGLGQGAAQLWVVEGGHDNKDDNEDHNKDDNDDDHNSALVADVHHLPSGGVHLVVATAESPAPPRLLAAAHRVLRLPLFGFLTSVPYPIAVALAVQGVLVACGSLRGSLDPHERAELRARWFGKVRGATAPPLCKLVEWAERAEGQRERDEGHKKGAVRALHNAPNISQKLEARMWRPDAV